MRSHESADAIQRRERERQRERKRGEEGLGRERGGRKGEAVAPTSEP